MKASFVTLSLLAAATLVLSGCSAAQHRVEVRDDSIDRVSVGAVQREIRVGMTSGAVAEILGAPNIVSTDVERREVWIWDKISSELVEALEHCYHQLLPILADSPAKAVYWDANVDSMITYPAYLKKDLLPWWQKAADLFHSKDKLLFIHPDGENNLLLDILADCGADVCEAVTPYPMTKVSIDEYYDTWCRSEKLTIWGGIPESLLLEKSATDEEFEAYLDHLFKAISPGTRFIADRGFALLRHSFGADRRRLQARLLSGTRSASGAMKSKLRVVSRKRCRRISRVI